jgi:hypothetical protein
MSLNGTHSIWWGSGLDLQAARRQTLRLDDTGGPSAMLEF